MIPYTWDAKAEKESKCIGLVYNTAEAFDGWRSINYYLPNAMPRGIMRKRNHGHEAADWDNIAGGWTDKKYSTGVLAEHKRKVYFNLITKWADVSSSRSILKTDLFAEAFGTELFLLDIARINSNIVGIDVSQEIVNLAKENVANYGMDSSQYTCADVRWLPFSDNSFDLIISDSTLDHFENEDDIIASLRELARVLQNGGTLILTLDNKRNLTYPPYFLFRLWMRLGLSPYFIGRTLSLNRLKKALEDINLQVVESTAIFHYPHPDGLVRWTERSLHRLGRGKFDNALRHCLAILDRLEHKPTRYLTGRYIAVKAVKVSKATEA
jgi:ubiquinone/menaquinone biosynthesis C-methylase UbiE